MFGRFHQFPCCGDELICCLGRKGSLTIFRADPGIDIGNAHGDAAFLILKSDRLPELGDVVLAANWGRFVCHGQFLFSFRRLKGGFSQVSSGT